MLIELLTENENIEKSRKSLMVASIFVPLFAAVKFISEELSVLGITVQVSQERIVQIGQLAVAYLLFVFIIRLLPGLVEWIHNYLEIRDKAWEHERKSAFSDLYDPEDYNGPDTELEDYEIDFYKTKTRREARRLYVKTASNFVLNTVVSLLNFAIPVLFGLAAIIQPSYLNKLLTLFSAV